MLGLLRENARSSRSNRSRAPGTWPSWSTTWPTSGLPVEFTVEGPARRLPPGVELTVYRIVQEALTNALKHAAPTTAQVRLRYDDQSVRISVRDAGRTHGSGTADANRVGHRLIGMRERVGLYGGSLEAAGTPEEGFTVTTLLPLEAQQ